MWPAPFYLHKGILYFSKLNIHIARLIQVKKHLTWIFAHARKRVKYKAVNLKFKGASQDPHDSFKIGLGPEHPGTVVVGSHHSRNYP